MHKLARLAYRRRRYVVTGWVALLLGLFAISMTVGGEFRTEFKLPGSESQEALDVLMAKGFAERTGFQGQVVFTSGQGIDSAGVRQAIEGLFSRIQSEVHGLEIVSPYDPANAHQVNPDRTVAYAEINFSDRPQEEYLEQAERIKQLRDEVNVSGLRIELGGDMFADIYEPSAEGIGLIAAVIILMVAFGSIIAMGLPIMTALFGVGCGVAIIGIVTRVLAVPDFTSQIAMMIGIGVGIDYALLIVTRYRNGLRDGLEPERAVALALNTAGRAVIFAGVTVVISLLGMFMMNMDFMRAVAIGCASAVLMTMLAAVTLLPALLGFSGRSIDRFGLPHRLSAGESGLSESFWFRWSRIIQRNPWPAFLFSTAFLLMLTVPLFTMQLGFGDAGNRHERDTSRRAYDLLSQGFGPGVNAPILIVAELNGPGDLAVLGQLSERIGRTPGVAGVSPPIPMPGGEVALMNVYATSAPQDRATTNLVHELRRNVVPSVVSGDSPNVLLSGYAPIVVDFSDYTLKRLPIFVGAVLALSFLLLTVVFRSVVLPVKAVLMNLLSIGGAFGAMVAIFQWGWFGSIFGVGKEGPIEAWAPMMLFAIVFGLSMDYEVFLLSRIREEYDKHGDNARAVADGLAATGRVISAAAAIMVCVFGSFVLSDDRALKLAGFGLAFAVFIDATIVRLILVPSAMEILGDRNWWAPAWLKRYLPRIKIEAEDEEMAEPERELALTR